jgi:hypothetical protein
MEPYAIRNTHVYVVKAINFMVMVHTNIIML